MTTKVDVAKASAQARLASLNESRVKLQERMSPTPKPTKVAKAKAADAKDGVVSLIGKIAAAPTVAAVAARNKTAAGIDTSVETAVPAAQSGVEGVGTVNDKVHDMIETFLTTLTSKLEDIPAKKDDLLAAAPLLKEAPAAKKAKRSGKGKGLITFGLLALAGAAAAYYVSQRQANNDPWAIADDELGAAPVESYQPATPAVDEPVVTTVVTPPAERQTEAGVSEDLLVADEVARPNDPLNPNPQGYHNGVENTPRVDDNPGRGL